jgi:hypothetical protein
MIVWLIITVVLLIWNAVYCARKIVADLRGPKPASGVWGLFALAGALSMMSWCWWAGALPLQEFSGKRNVRSPPPQAVAFASANANCPKSDRQLSGGNRNRR